MELNELRDKIHRNAVNKGFYDGLDNLSNELKHAYIAQKIALIHSELSEALEADRKCSYANWGGGPTDISSTNFEAFIKDTFEDELSDAMIRIFDLCGWLNIDIDTHIKLKMEYNESREQKHGKKY